MASSGVIAATGLSMGIINFYLFTPPSAENQSTLGIFGVAVSSFGLAKLIGNVPTAKWVDELWEKTGNDQGQQR